MIAKNVMASEPEVTTVATVFYGGASVLADTLPTWYSSLKSIGANFSFVDNTPGDEVQVLLSRLGFLDYPGTAYIKSDVNLGFALAANLAVSNAVTDKVLLLNPDTYLDHYTAGQVLSESISDDYPFVAFGLQTEGVVHSGISINKFGFFVDSTRQDATIIGPSGGAMLLNKHLFLNLGGFSAQLFAWGEDAEFALRLCSLGVQTRRSSIVIKHFGGHTVDSEAGARIKARLINRNRVLILRATYSRTAIAVWLPILLVAILGNVILRRKKRQTMVQALVGVFEGLTNTPYFSWPQSQRLSLSTVNKLCWSI